ncbi:methionine synthase [uncultured Sphaerochaeta sp.]|uniref:methionine synthase n=1 Tax=uncultured Sphaerochaeta sp. TaxID=886478 RepID=UPI002A0A5287|nr:methionine synthase [uncultured Sphaerochaeta sp.]
MDRQQFFLKLLSERVLVLDGAMGTMIQKQHLSDEDFYLEDLKAVGCNELLSLTRGDVIFTIHTEYLESGADIITTNTFCGNAFNLEEYGLASEVETLNRAACEIAREAAADFERTHERFVFIAGTLGPTNRGLSFSSDVDDPTNRKSDFASFEAMYCQQAEVLLDGGVDLLLIETVFDTLAAKAAVRACLKAMEIKERKVPIMVSVTFSDLSGRTLSGQTLEAFVATLSPFPIFSLGLNCSTGPEQMLPLIERLNEISPFFISAHPNAGFPDKEGQYTLSPGQLASQLAPVLAKGCLNIVGGCCGTTPEHISAIKEIADKATVHVKTKREPTLVLSGLEPIEVQKGSFVVIGERTNVAGSRKFARLVKEGNWEEALSIARKQVVQGAQVIDVCMDASMLEAIPSMVTFLRQVSSDPSISKVPVMIDSSDWNVIEVALGEIQGRGIVNSISLKEGEEKFLSHAHCIESYGCAMVVMLFDEEGQADHYERKIAIAKRSYDVLIQDGIHPENIIFDANVLSIATGIDEHDLYAKDFIRASHWIMENLPYAHTSGGISNLSFSFRGNDGLRNAMHAIFLDLAKLDMAIVNPGSDRNLASIPSHARLIIERALYPEDSKAVEARQALIELALSGELTKPEGNGEKPIEESWKSLGPEQRLGEAIYHGENSFLQADLAILDTMDPIQIVEGPLMEGMKKVGKLFSEGKLFLPQVVRSARTMKLAVDILGPRITAFLTNQNNTIGFQKKKIAVMATVKGDVHDIGKNIVNLILTCNNFEVIDLGVMVPAQKILEAAQQHKADLVGLSGLITPSLKEMAFVVSLFEQQGCTIPIFVGGATTSELHTAVKLAPLYNGNPVIQTQDASAMAFAAQKVMGDQKGLYLSELAKRYELLRNDTSFARYPRTSPALQGVGYAKALELARQKEEGSHACEYGIFTLEQFSLEDLLPLINWKMYSTSWKVPLGSQEAEKLVSDAKEMLGDSKVAKLILDGCKAVCGLFPATSDRMTITVENKDFHFLRNEATGLCLADYVAEKNDTAGLMVVSSSLAIGPYLQELKQQGDDYKALSLQMICDRLVEVLAQKTELFLQKKWGLAEASFVRPAPGYPSWGDHSEKQGIFELLGATSTIGVRLTENFAMDPASSICAMVLGGKDLRYFSIGKVSEEQLELYAKAKGMHRDELAMLLQGME